MPSNLLNYKHSLDLSTVFVDKRGALILKIALDAPLRRLFDYLPPAQMGEAIASAGLAPGVRVRVPFGRRHLIGILVAMAPSSRPKIASRRCAGSPGGESRRLPMPFGRRPHERLMPRRTR